jgi:hypothetical protein
MSSIFTAHRIAGAIHNILVFLHKEVILLSKQHPNIALEDSFDGTIVINLTSGLPLSSQLPANVPVVIRHLSTPQRFSGVCDQNSAVPAPALDSSQLDRFIDIGLGICTLDELTWEEVGYFSPLLQPFSSMTTEEPDL